MTDTKLLNEYIDRSGLKINYIAKYLGRSRYGFMQKRDNINEFLPSEIEKLCFLLKIDSLEERNRIFFANQVSLNATENVENRDGC